MPLTKNQLRRLEQGMADPLDGHEGITIRKDHIIELVKMIRSRELFILEFITNIENEIESGKCMDALQRTRQFWLSKDKWNN